MRVEGGDQKIEADFIAISISNRIGRIPRRLTFADGSLFETSDNEAIDAFLKAHGADRTGWVHDLERFHPRLFAFAALAILLIAGVYRYGLPVLVEVAVAVTPPIVPQMMASGTMETLDRTVFSPSQLPAGDIEKIRSGFLKIAEISKRGSQAYNLNFRKGGIIGPNAFALPDGTLVITDELVKLAKADHDLILGVLAHEIGHVELDHSLRQLYHIVGMTGLIMLIAGDVGSGTEDIMTNGAAFLSLSHSRGAESEADQRSVELMLKAGLDPLAIGRFFKLLEEKLGDKGSTSMFSTHPGTPERRNAIEDYARLLQSKAAGK